MFKKIRKGIIISKIFAQRTMSYLSVINSGMILFLLLSNLEKYGIDINLTQWFVPIFIIGMIALVVLGYFEDRLGFFKEEQETVSHRNPYFREILDRLDRIENNK